MKSEIIQQTAEQKLKFPCLMRSATSGDVYLITGSLSNGYVGTRIFSDNIDKIGEHCDYWGKEALYFDTNLSIKLSNQ